MPHGCSTVRIYGAAKNSADFMEKNDRSQSGVQSEPPTKFSPTPAPGTRPVRPRKWPWIVAVILVVALIVFIVMRRKPEQAQQAAGGRGGGRGGAGMGQVVIDTAT